MTAHHIRHVRMMPSHDKRRQLMARTSEYVVQVERDWDYDPREFDCYTEAECKKFDTGEWKAWNTTLFRACPDHGVECRHTDIIDSLCGSAVTSDRDLEGDYASPYFISDAYIRSVAWDMWQDRNR